MKRQVFTWLVSVFFVLTGTLGCTLFTETDLGDRPPEQVGCEEGATRCSGDGNRIEECVCADDNCAFQAQQSCPDGQQCTQGVSSTQCADLCPDGSPQRFFALDADGDDYAQADSEQLSCSSPGESFRLSEELQRQLDCNDSNPDVNPGEAEATGNSLDENCDGRIACFIDSDRDTFVAFSGTGPETEEIEESQCRTSDGYAEEASEEADCDDSESEVNPEATEECNGRDDDCDGAPDSGPGQDSDLAGICFGAGERCDSDDVCAPGACRGLTTLRDGVCVSDGEPTCAEYCSLYEKVEDSCDMFLPATVENCGANPEDCDEPPARELCIEACRATLSGTNMIEAYDVGSYEDGNNVRSLGCRADFLVDAIMADSNGAKAALCHSGTLTMGGFCGTAANLEPCGEPGTDGRRVGVESGDLCAYGSRCSSLAGDDYYACLPRCRVDPSENSNITGRESACPSWPDFDGVTGKCVASAGGVSVQIDGEVVSPVLSVRCLYECDSPDQHCRGPLGGGVGPASVIDNRECAGWAAARSALDSTCLADVERVPGLLCTREVNGGRVANDEDILQELGAEDFLAALNDAATSADIATELGVTTCFSDNSDLCTNPDVIRYPPACQRQADVDCEPKGCEDCIKELRDCLSDRCGSECRSSFSPSGSLSFDQPECACCGLNEKFGGGGDPRTCMKNFRWCSGITEDFFEDFASEPIAGDTCINL